MISDAEVDRLHEVIRSFGYTTHGQSREIAQYLVRHSATLNLAGVAGGDAADAVVVAAKALVDKMEVVSNDKQYIGVWFCAQNHSGPYTGPKYNVELLALCEALSALEKGNEHGN